MPFGRDKEKKLLTGRKKKKKKVWGEKMLKT